MPTGFPVVIYHNPACSTSRKVLGMIEAAGYQPEIVEYLKAGWTRPQLVRMFKAAGLTARQALRMKAPEAEELGLTADGVSASTIIAAMVKHPFLVERPFVSTPRGVRLCRPAELVLDLLDR